jgi:hypothetical protein
LASRVFSADSYPAEPGDNVSSCIFYGDAFSLCSKAASRPQQAARPLGLGGQWLCFRNRRSSGHLSGNLGGLYNADTNSVGLLFFGSDRLKTGVPLARKMQGRSYVFTCF